MAAHENETFRVVYEKHYAAILGYCLRRAHRDSAPDIASDVFVVAWRKRESMPEAEFVLPWLYAVAANTMANHRRTLRRRTSLMVRARRLTLGDEPSPEIQVIRRTEDVAVIDAVRRLRPNDQELILLSAWEGLSAPQIASRFQISLSAAEKRLSRAKRRLGAELTRTDKMPETGRLGTKGWTP